MRNSGDLSRKDLPSTSLDTLVSDCEGALYYILLDTPELLNGMKTLIVENDYDDIEKKRFVYRIVTEKGFRRVYVKSGGFGPCSAFFFEVWVM